MLLNNVKKFYWVVKKKNAWNSIFCQEQILWIFEWKIGFQGVFNEKKKQSKFSQITVNVLTNQWKIFMCSFVNDNMMFERKQHMMHTHIGLCSFS